jgi:hypothetical protein
MKTKKLKSINLSKLTPPVVRNIKQDKFPTKITLSGDLVFPKGVNTIAIFGAVDYIAEAIKDYIYKDKLNKYTSYSLDSEVTLITGQEIHFHTSLLKLSEYNKNQIYLVRYLLDERGNELFIDFGVESPLIYKGAKEISDDQFYKNIRAFRYQWTPVTITEVVDMYVSGVNAASEPKKDKSLLSKLFEFFRR